MKILKPGIVTVDIGPLDAAIKLPMASRRSRGMRTLCDACGRTITDEFFVGAFKSGHANLKLHLGCVPAETRIQIRQEDGTYK